MIIESYKEPLLANFIFYNKDDFIIKIRLTIIDIIIIQQLN